MKKRIGIIGNGAVGSFFARSFSQRGHSVVVGDVKEQISSSFPLARSNREVVRGADVIFICIPTGGVSDVLVEIAPALSEKKLVVFASSALEDSFATFRKLKRRGRVRGSVCAAHILFAPSADVSGFAQGVFAFVMDGLFMTKGWEQWIYETFAEATVSQFKTARDHDFLMSVYQIPMQVALVACVRLVSFCSGFRSLNGIIPEPTTLFFKMGRALSARALKQWRVYAEILIHNQFARGRLRDIANELSMVADIAEKGDHEGLKRYFEDAHWRLGKEAGVRVLAEPTDGFAKHFKK